MGSIKDRNGLDLIEAVEKAVAPTPGLLPGESQGRGSLIGCGLWGHTGSDTTEATWQQQQERKQSY